VCTIEKANIIVNSLLDQSRKQQLLMVVVDEIHLIGDSGRGFLLEVLLSKVFCCIPQGCCVFKAFDIQIRFAFEASVQIVGMSATLPNLLDLSIWLDAALFTTTYRPVSLSTYVCFDRTIHGVVSFSDAVSAPKGTRV
jgi:DNA polymerase theta